MKNDKRGGRSSGHFRGAEWFLPALLACAVCLAYANTLHVQFTFDDNPNIVENPHIRITELSFDSLRRAAFESFASRRPVANISFALNYFVHQYNVVGFHLVNICIHIIAGLALYFLIKATLNLPVNSRFHTPGGKWLPFAATLIWLIHPLQIQSVTYIVQRMNSMAAMFFVVSMLCYVKARQAGGTWKKGLLFASCVIAGILGLGSKEIAITLPFFILLYEWFFFQDMSPAWLRRRFVVVVAVAALLVLAACLYLGGNPFTALVSGFQERDFTLAQRLLTELRVVVFYLSLLLVPLPSRLNLDHDFLLSSSLFEPAGTLLSLMLLAGLLATAIFSARRHRLVSFCIIWFLGNHVLESSVVSLELVFEHRNYLPSMMGVLPVVLLGHRLLRPGRLQAAVFVAVVLVLAAFTIERNHTWRDRLGLWSDSVQKSPNKARPLFNLGFQLFFQGKTEEAAGYFRRALEVRPGYPEASRLLAAALDHMGRADEAITVLEQSRDRGRDIYDSQYNIGVLLLKEGRHAEAIVRFSDVLAKVPEYKGAHGNWGRALEGLGKTGEAMSHYLEELGINPESPGTHNDVGRLFMAMGRFEDAEKHFAEALRLDPAGAVALYNMGLLHLEQGQQDRAAEFFGKSVDIDPGNRAARFRLAGILESQGNNAEAADHWRAVLRREPNNFTALLGLGITLGKLGKLDEAVEMLSGAVAVKPSDKRARNNLGTALTQLGRYKEAVEQFSAALEIDPSYALARKNLNEVLPYAKSSP